MKTIILAGGSGTRLWPLSRADFPKQFLRLRGMEHSLFQMAAQRGLLFGAARDIYVVSGGRYAAEIRRQLHEIGCDIPAGNLLLEPCAKNTLPAILAGALAVEAAGGDEVLVLPSDHLMKDTTGFKASVKKALPFTKDALVTFGIRPTGPETGYGYVQPGRRCGDGFYVEMFREKPNHETAVEYIRQGCLWNSGMFLFHSGVFVREVARCAPEVYAAFIENELDAAFEKTPSISIDYGLMEKASRVAAVPLESDWNDLGGFSSFYDVYRLDADVAGNICDTEDILIDAGGNLVYSDTGKAVALVGVDNLVVVDQRDALLVCGKNDTQKLKDVTARLTARGDSRVQTFPLVQEDWGSEELLEDTESCAIWRLQVLPGEVCRREGENLPRQWTITRGQGHLGKAGEILSSAKGAFIPQGEPAEIHNNGGKILEIIEIQIKTSLGSTL